MSELQSFLPVASPDAKKLVLGSMPGSESLMQGQYYANTRNSFWRIMGELFDVPDNAPYELRLDYLTKNKIALWDVIKTCRRAGSLDSAIEERSIVANDFKSFFQQHPGIKTVFFNGAKSEQAYRRYVLPDIAPEFSGLVYSKLPSTSPANARYAYEAKYKAWTVVKNNNER